LIKSGKSIIYPLIDRLIWFIVTLSISTKTTKWDFSAIKIVKTSNLMEDDFFCRLFDCLYIKKEIAEKYSINMIINDFCSMREQRRQLK
jgi:hypothetical protein